MGEKEGEGERETGKEEKRRQGESSLWIRLLKLIDVGHIVHETRSSSVQSTCEGPSGVLNANNEYKGKRGEGMGEEGSGGEERAKGDVVRQRERREGAVT